MVTAAYDWPSYGINWRGRLQWIYVEQLENFINKECQWIVCLGSICQNERSMMGVVELGNAVLSQASLFEMLLNQGTGEEGDAAPLTNCVDDIVQIVTDDGVCKLGTGSVTIFKIVNQ